MATHRDLRGGSGGLIDPELLISIARLVAMAFADESGVVATVKAAAEAGDCAGVWARMAPLGDFNRRQIVYRARHLSGFRLWMAMPRGADPLH